MILPRLMLVTDRRRIPPGEQVQRVAAAIQGGVRLVQVREADLGVRDLEDLVRAIRDAALPETVVILNGRPELARALGCGLHLPAGAAAPDRGASSPFGRSAHGEAEARAAQAEGVDYLIFGAVYPTASKPGHPGLGAEAVRRVATIVAPLPLYAIGGVTAARIPDLIAAGAHGVAVCSAILASSDPRRRATEIALALNAAGGPVTTGRR